MTRSACVITPLPVPKPQLKQICIFTPSSSPPTAARGVWAHSERAPSRPQCVLPYGNPSSAKRPLFLPIDWTGFLLLNPSFVRLLGNQQKKSKRTCDKHVLLPLDYTHSGYLDLQTSNSVSCTADKHRETPKSYPALLSSRPTFNLCTVHQTCYCTVWGERELIETRCTC